MWLGENHAEGADQSVPFETLSKIHHRPWPVERKADLDPIFPEIEVGREGIERETVMDGKALSLKKRNKATNQELPTERANRAAPFS